MDTVSVVIPVRNGRDYILEAIDSALDQGCVVAEVIVIDDGSTDDTAALVAGLADSRVRLTAGESRGVSAARNLGLAQAGARWVLFLDADDRLRPDAIAGLMAGYTEDAVALYGDYERINDAGETIGRRGLLRKRNKPSGQILTNLLGGNFIVNGGVMLIDRLTFAGFGGFDESLRYCEDWHAWCRLAATGPIVYRPDTHVLDYRVHAASTMMGRVHTLDDYRPALEAIYADPAICAKVDVTRREALRTRAESHLNAYLLGQAARSHRYGAMLSGLFDTLLRRPRAMPRTLAVCGAAVVGI